MNNDYSWKYEDKHNPIKLISDFDSSLVCHSDINALGRSIHIMQNNGIAVLTLAIPTLKADTMYLDFISVNPINRNKGWGTKLLKLTEIIAEYYFCHEIKLNVQKDSDAERWYYKHGYSFCQSIDDYPEYVCLIKKLSY